MRPFYLLFCLAAAAAVVWGEKLTPILPGDPYNVVGDIEKRHLGRCTYLYAWLAIPTGSHQDIYAHYSACSRLELRFMEAAREVRASQPDHKVSVGEELNRVNKDYAAQLIDLETLDALLQTVKVTDGVQTSPPLTSKDRIFYLSDRLGQYTMLAMLRPGRLPKIEIIPPPSEKTHIHPQNVLCYRKFCKPTIKPTSSAMTTTSNITTDYIFMLTQAKKENERLYIQLIIYRIVFALAAFLCVIFGICSLILCFRLRSSRTPKKRHAMDGSYLNAHSYTQLNGAYKFGAPFYVTDANGCPINAANATSDTMSLHNTAISSTFSGCEVLAAPGSGYSGMILPQHYPMDPAAGPPKVIRLSATGMQNAYVAGPALNRSVSPASEGYRTGSLDRRSDIGSEKLQRRNQPSLVALPPGVSLPPNTTFIPVNRNCPNFVQNSYKMSPSIINDHTLASQVSGNTVIHKFPADLSYHGSINGDSVSNGGLPN